MIFWTLQCHLVLVEVEEVEAAVVLVHGVVVVVAPQVEGAHLVALVLPAGGLVRQPGGRRQPHLLGPLLSTVRLLQLQESLGRG